MKLSDLAMQVRAASRVMMETGARVEPRPWGAFISSPTFPLYDLGNCAWIDRWPHGFTVENVIEEVAERCAEHRIPKERIYFMDSRLALPVQAALEEAGFSARASYEMIHLRRTDVEPRADVTVKEATRAEDIAAVWTLMGEGLGEDGFPEEDARQVLAFSPPKYETLSIHLFLAEVNGHPAGHATMFSHGGVGYILDLFTRTSDRRRGVGSALVLHLVSASREAGNRITGLTTSSTNGPAQTLYRKLGFFAAGEERYVVRDAAR
jgi:ribosomal protein S18 acetylase RimI-like enzyme